MKRKTRAFTLIELLVVVLIIGILAAIALPKYQVAVARARFVQAKALANSIADAQERYYLANGEYADAFDKLDIDLPPSHNERNTDTNRVYDWGNCETNGINGAAFCRYRFPSFSIQYQIPQVNSGATGAGHHICVAERPTTTPSDTFCQNETGKTTPDVIGGGWYMYFYN